MIFAKKEKEYKNKKFLLVIFILMIVAAIGLSIANFFESKREEGREKIVQNDESVGPTIGAQNYSAPIGPELRENDRILGNKQAKFKIFVYEDYDDVFSSELAITIDRLVRERGEDIAFVFRPFIGASSNSALKALALDCAGSNWQALRREMMLSLENNSNQELQYMINKVGILETEFSSCLAKQNELDRVKEIKSEALAHEVIGSPTIFIGNELVLGARPYENYLDSNGDDNEGLNDLIGRILKVDKKD